MTTTDKQLSRAVVPIGIALVVLITVALALGAWAGAYCH